MDDVTKNYEKATAADQLSEEAKAALQGVVLHLDFAKRLLADMPDRDYDILSARVSIDPDITAHASLEQFRYLYSAVSQLSTLAFNAAKEA